MTNLEGHWSVAMLLITCFCFGEILLVPLGLGYSGFNATTSVPSLKSTYTHDMSRFCKIGFRENQIFSSATQCYQSHCNLIFRLDKNSPFLSQLQVLFLEVDASRETWHLKPRGDLLSASRHVSAPVSDSPLLWRFHPVKSYL